MKPIIATLFLIVVPSIASAQLAKIAGIVVDPQPARITQAKVVVAGERDRHELTSDEEGFFQGNLDPGWYVITVSHYGFETRQLKLFLKADVVTPHVLEECSRVPSFSEGKKYLVYAYESKNKSLVIGEWNASKPLWDASEDLKELKRKESLFQFRVAHGSK